MSFTDSDLKRLKELAKQKALSGLEPDIVALLARLEAAEKVIKEIDEHFLSDHDYVERLIETWRKAVGK